MAVAGVIAAAAITMAGAQQPQLGCTGPRLRLQKDTIAFTVDSVRGWSMHCDIESPSAPLVSFSRTMDAGNMNGFMLIDVWIPSDSATKPLEDRVAESVLGRRIDIPDIEAKAAGRIVTRSGEVALVREFVSQKRGGRQLIAYIPRGRNIPYIVVHLPFSGSSTRYRADFETLVKSYSSRP
jgi:hypothetical protein